MPAQPQQHRNNACKVIPLKSNARHFVVLTTQRTGSSWLMDYLDSSPEVEAHMELFYPYPRIEPPRAGCNDYPRFIESAHASARFRARAVYRYLNELQSRKQAVGFKLMYSQLRAFPEIIAWLAWRRIPVVHLFRRNHLDVVISAALADATGTSHATVQENARHRDVSLQLDPDEVVRKVRRLAQKQRVARALLTCMPNRSMETCYEQLCADPAAFEPLLDFLGINAKLLSGETTLVKRQRKRHEDILENYPAVRDALTAAGYEALLDESRLTTGAA